MGITERIKKLEIENNTRKESELTIELVWSLGFTLLLAVAMFILYSDVETITSPSFAAKYSVVMMCCLAGFVFFGYGTVQMATKLGELREKTRKR